MKKYKTPTHYPLYETSYGSETPFNQFYTILFDVIPSKFTNKVSYDINCLDYFKENGFEEIIRNEISKKIYVLKSTNIDYSFDVINDERYFINEDKKILIKIILKKEALINSIQMIEILYDLSKGAIIYQLDFLSLIKFEREKKKSNIHLVKSDMGHLDTEEFELNIPEIDLKLNYGESFLKIHELIVKRLNTDHDKGIILLHGDPGTGKTSYIKFLTKMIGNKDILFIPPSMAEALSEPNIIPFLMDHKNSILIIEDAERVISDRELNGSSAGVSNILNLTDGILGDCLNIQIIATFNMKREKIDQALLRKGRLIAEHKFSPLSIKETNDLFKSLNKNYTSDKEMCLADIYNVDVEQYVSNNNNNKIGFSR